MRTHSSKSSTVVTKCLAVILLFLSVSQVAFAQNQNRKLVLGSVYRVVRDLIEVKQESGDLAVIRVDSATRYIDSTTKAPAKLKDIAVGDQIVIKVFVKAGVDTAEEVKFVSALGNKK